MHFFVLVDWGWKTMFNYLLFYSQKKQSLHYFRTELLHPLGWPMSLCLHTVWTRLRSWCSHVLPPIQTWTPRYWISAGGANASAQFRASRSSLLLLWYEFNITEIAWTKFGFKLFVLFKTMLSRCLLNPQMKNHRVMPKLIYPRICRSWHASMCSLR